MIIPPPVRSAGCHAESPTPGFSPESPLLRSQHVPHPPDSKKLRGLPEPFQLLLQAPCRVLLAPKRSAY
nr:hypothetical protein CVNMHQAP_CVNMHQAP_CDS_0149 [uncultured phage]